MGRNLFQELGGREGAAGGIGANREHWLHFVPGIVAENEDPENQHRIKVIIPSIDADEPHDEWVKQVGVYVGGNGYGSFFVPPIGSEVVLNGQLGQKHTLFYMCVYNEEFIVPADFRDTAIVGVRAPADMKHIAEGDYQLRAGRVLIETDASLRIIAPGGVFIGSRRIG